MLTDIVWDAICCSRRLRDATGTHAIRNLLAEKKEATELIEEKLASGENPSTFHPRDSGSGFHPSAIIIASANGDHEILRILLSSPLADVSAIDHDGDCALTLAAMNGYPSCISILAAAGADQDARDARGWTPMMLAADGGNMESCQLLAALSRWSWEDCGKDGTTLLKIAQRDDCIFALLSANMENRILAEATPSSKSQANCRTRSLGQMAGRAPRRHSEGPMLPRTRRAGSAGSRSPSSLRRSRTIKFADEPSLRLRKARICNPCPDAN